MTTALTCSQCGAALPPHAASVVATCAFCGTTSTPAAKVIERIVERVVVVSAEPEGGDPSAMPCPRCARGMERVRGGGQEAPACTKCGGAFITNEQIAMFGKRRNDDFAKAVLHVSPFFGRLEPRRGLLSCPTCSAPLRVVEIEGTVNLMHVCDAHGAFFERNSLTEFNEACANQRAGDIDEEDLEAMGVKPRGLFDFFKR